MSEWSETILRRAASWQAFKEGRGLWESGVVTEAKRGPAGWTGTVRAGTRPTKVAVKVNSETDLGVRCSCPANRATGEVCAHAVATGLALLHTPPAPAAAPAAQEPHPAAPRARALSIHFPANWQDAFRRQRLSCEVRAADGPPSAADERLAGWLREHRLDPPTHLHLGPDKLAVFLALAEDHPRASAGGERLTVAAGSPIPVDACERQGEAVKLVPAGPLEAVEIGGNWWRFDPQGIHGLGSGPAPDPDAVRRLVSGKPAAISMPAFFRDLDAWRDWLIVPPDSWIEELRFVPAPVRVEAELDGTLGAVRCCVSIRHADANPVPPGHGEVPELPRLQGDACLVRNSEAEARVRERLRRAGFAEDAPGSWVLRDESAATRWAALVLPRWKAEWSIRETSAFQRARQGVVSVRPRIEVIGESREWMDFKLQFESSDGALLEPAEVRNLLRSGGAGRGRKVIVSPEVEEWLDPLFTELDLRQERGAFTAGPAAAAVIQEIRKNLGQAAESETDGRADSVALPASLRAELRPYQRAGYRWLSDRLERFGGALLADDMGLGKTLQTIASIERLLSGDSQPVLVVVTASLLGNWRSEFARFAPDRCVRVLHGSGRDAERDRVRGGDVVLTSYGTLARDLAWHLRQDYALVVLDEASVMRNPRTDHAKAIFKLRTPRRLALTGTPVENGVRDLWSIFRFVQPGWLGTHEDFAERYEQPLASDDPPRALLGRLRLKISPFVLRRTKAEVAPELPSKIHIDEWCELSADQRRVYREVLEEGRRRVERTLDAGQAGAARMQVLTALLRLRQTCCDLALLGSEKLQALPVPRRSAKLERLLELVEEARAGGHRMLVFSQFRVQLEEIAAALAGRHMDHLMLHGQTRNRHELVERFQRPDGPPVFLISLKAGGYGLNLTAADTVVHFDPWWNPAAEAQATDRAHRIGQTRPVTVHRLIARGTVESQVLAMQARKRAVAEALEDPAAEQAAGWSERDLQALLAGA